MARMDGCDHGQLLLLSSLFLLFLRFFFLLGSKNRKGKGWAAVSNSALHVDEPTDKTAERNRTANSKMT